MVIYRSKMHASLKRNFQVMPGVEWLELAPGDVIESSGYREGVGAPSSIVAGSVQRLAQGQIDACAAAGQ